MKATGTSPAPPLRQEILVAAGEILAREGYDGLSMRKVARRINHSATAIYIYFKDRDDLVACVCGDRAPITRSNSPSNRTRRSASPG